MYSIIVQGRLEIMSDHEDFAQLLREKLGEGAANYFRNALTVGRKETADYFEDVLDQCRDILKDWDLDHMTRLDLKKARKELMDMINSAM